MTKAAQNLLLILVGVAVLWITVVTDEYLNYVKPSFRFFLVPAALAVIALGAAGLRREWRDDPATDAHAHAQRPGSPYEHGDQSRKVGQTDSVDRDDDYVSDTGHAGGVVQGSGGVQLQVSGVDHGDGVADASDADRVSNAERVASGVSGANPAASGGVQLQVSGVDHGDGAADASDADRVSGADRVASGVSGTNRAASGVGGADYGDDVGGAGSGGCGLPGDDGGHSHGRGPRVAWLMCVPAMAIFLIAPPALGSFTATRNSARTVTPATPAQGFGQLPNNGAPVEMTMGEFIGRSFEEQTGTPGSIRGIPVTLTGFVTPRKKGDWYVTRLRMTCCAGDAIPMQVIVHGLDAPSADTWVKVTGTWRQPAGGLSTGVYEMDARSLAKIKKPKNAYE